MKFFLILVGKLFRFRCKSDIFVELSKEYFPQIETIPQIKKF